VTTGPICSGPGPNDQWLLPFNVSGQLGQTSGPPWISQLGTSEIEYKNKTISPFVTSTQKYLFSETLQLFPFKRSIKSIFYIKQIGTLSTFLSKFWGGHFMKLMLGTKNLKKSMCELRVRVCVYL
jgi:hypothetical protein